MATITRQQLGNYIMESYRNGVLCYAFDLAHRIDTHLALGSFQFHSRDGWLLTNLDEVINAILNDNLLEDLIPPVRIEYITLPRQLIEHADA